MAKYAIITDSACDLNKAYRIENCIDYAKTMYSYEENGQLHELEADLDWENISCKDFYNILRRGIRIFTSQVTAQNYLDVFLPHLQKGEDILYVACSSGLSASLKAAQLLAENELKEQFPDRKIIVVDTLRAGMSQGSIVMLAVDLMKQGKTIEENTAILEQEKTSYKEVGIPESLSYLRRAGRVKASAAFFGNIISLKPILVFDEKGSNIAIEKAIGKKKAFNRMAEMIKEDIVDPENQEIYLMNADCNLEDIEYFKNAILKQVQVKDIVVETLGPVIGASSGPGTIIVNYKGR
jgi:DegV family protein with EDD domain